MQTATEAKLGGRPPLTDDKRKVVVQVRMSPDMIAALDAVAASSADGADRSQIIRQFVAEALAARGKGRK